MELTLFAQGISILATLFLLMLARYIRDKHHSLERIASAKDQSRLDRYSVYYGMSIMLSILACITAFVLMIMQIYYALN